MKKGLRLIGPRPGALCGSIAISDGETLLGRASLMLSSAEESEEEDQYVVIGESCLSIFTAATFDSEESTITTHPERYLEAV